MYSTGELNKKIVNKLKEEKGNLYLCSLSRKCDNELMWSHYAEGHRGVAIGLIVSSNHNVRPIQYTGPAYVKEGHLDNDTQIEILSHKLNIWTYEEERVFIRNKVYIDVEVKQVITGRAMTPQDYRFIKQIVEKINPQIELIKANSFM
ncbi:MAG: hypothetical protein JWQ09_2456 [Segetibacter sp.]|nr:hypothetical protein [Segetibacter sp.]